MQDEQDRLTCLRVTKDDFHSFCALNGRRNHAFPGNVFVTRIASLFIRSLETCDGTFYLHELDIEKRSFHSDGLLTLRIMERKLCELRARGQVLNHTCLCLLTLAQWKSESSWFFNTAGVLMFMLFVGVDNGWCKRKKRFIIHHLISFFDGDLISITKAPRLIFLPICQIVCGIDGGLEVFRWAVLLVAIFSTLSTNLKLNYIASRWVLRIQLVSYVTMALNVLWSVLRSGNCFGAQLILTLEYSICWQLVKVCSMGVILGCALAKDAVVGLRACWRKTLIILCLLVSFVLMKLPGYMVPTIQLTAVFGIILFSPSVPACLKTNLTKGALCVISSLETLVFLGELISATLVIFQSDRKLGLKWGKYVLHTRHPMVWRSQDTVMPQTDKSNQ
jgi:hypothetical protein